MPDRPFAGAEVLPGVALLASPVEAFGDRWLRATLDLLVAGTASATAFDWTAPYSAQDRGISAVFWTNVVEWRVEVFESGAALHSFDIEWPADQEVGMRFRSATRVGTQVPTLRCDDRGCRVQ